MAAPAFSSRSLNVLSDYGMLAVLLLLCGYFSWVTIDTQHPAGASGGRELGAIIARNFASGAQGMIVGRSSGEDVEFADAVKARLESAGLRIIEVIKGQPPEARQSIQRFMEAGGRIDFIACTPAVSAWPVFQDLREKFPSLASVPVLTVPAYRWPNFLKRDNLLNIANQIAVIAIIAIGMTMVIITGGIDLSVGSLIALSAVIATGVIRDAAGAEHASALGMTLGCAVGMAACSFFGAFSGVMVTLFGIPAFIVTLGMMLVASGLAFLFARGQSIYQVPDSFIWLGRGADLGIPNAVLLMFLLYLLAHGIMTRTTLGRYIYAIGGNIEAARLSGVPIRRVLIFVYTLSGLLAGLGGVIMASQLKSGSPTYGGMYELYVIAAVVVGGTSLAGGEGKILGTLIGAFIIAVIQNGMNLTGVESYTQKVVLGVVILGAVLLDRFKQRGWDWLRRRQR